MVLLGKPVLFILNHDRVSNGDDAHKGFAILLSKFPLLSRMGGACSPNGGDRPHLHSTLPHSKPTQLSIRTTLHNLTVHNSQLNRHHHACLLDVGSLCDNAISTCNISPGADLDQLAFAFVSRRIGNPRKFVFAMLCIPGGNCWTSVAADAAGLPALLLELRAEDLRSQFISGHGWMKMVLLRGSALGVIAKASGI